MKNKIINIMIVLFFTSCTSTSFYQVYKTASSDKLVVKDKLLVYEDLNCKVSYNLWDDGGNIGFQFFNKTEKNIYLNLEESFFILNGVSYNYFRNRVFTSSTTTGASSTIGTTATKSFTDFNYIDLVQTNKISATNSIGMMPSSGFSVSYNEQNIICIPSKTMKVISEYKINEILFRDCDLFKYPTKKQIKSKTFSKAQSPLVFSNRITYKLEQSDKFIKFENEFYVAEISNFPENELVESGYNEYCGQKSMVKTKYFKEVSADKFYIKYNKGKDTWKH